MRLDSISRESGSATETPSDSTRRNASIALAPYVEALVVGKRVAVLGDVTLNLAEELASRGARLVHAYDPESSRVAEALARRAPAFGSPAAGRPGGRGVVHALLSDDLGVRDGAFDAVLIPDLSLFSDRQEIVRRARKLVAKTGVVIARSPNPDAKRVWLRSEAKSGNGTPALGYYEMFDLLSLQFPVVRMVGQAPFFGYALVDFAPTKEPDVSFDASLMLGTEEPESFVAIASDRHVAIDPYVVIELPVDDALAPALAAKESVAAGPSSVRDVHRAPNDNLHMAEMQARVVLMEAELDDLRAEKMNLLTALDGAQKAESEARSLVQKNLEKSNERALEAEAARLKELESRAGDEHVRAERLTHKVRDLEEELVHQRDRAQRLTKQLDDEKRARQKAEIELGMTRGLSRPEPDPELTLRVEQLTSDLDRVSAENTSFAQTLALASARENGLASELLAKSKETAELRRELEASQTKAAELSRSLHSVQGRLEEAEEQAQTLRRPPPAREAIVVNEVDTGMLTRVARASAEANAERTSAQESRRAAAESRRAVELLTVQRDSANDRAEKLQTQLEHERGARKDLVVAKTSLETDVLALRRRMEELTTLHEAESAPEVQTLEGALKDRGHHIAKLERDLRESERIGRELVQELESLHAAWGNGGGGGFGPLGGSEPDRGGSQTRSFGAGSSPAHATQATPQAVQTANGSSAAAPTTSHAAPIATHAAPTSAAPAETIKSSSRADVISSDAFQHHIDALAADAAQKQGELVATTWKIQALERELETARVTLADPSRIQRELSNALVRAQSEIAELRRAQNLTGRESSGVPRNVVEDSGPLHQQLSR